MGWETRKGQSYYYRKERDGARVKSVYSGNGELSQLISILDDMKAEEEAKREAKRAERARDLLTEMHVSDVCDITKVLVQASLLAMGFHTHKRQWRRARDARECAD